MSPISARPAVGVRPFGALPDGTAVTLYELTLPSGRSLSVADYGATIVSINVPDRTGAVGDVVLGFDGVGGYTSDAYRAAPPYMGAVVGRYGNRIAGGRFELDGRTVELPTNEGGNHLHGGPVGFDQRMWSARPFERGDAVGVELSRVSPDGEQGYPGRLEIAVTYTFADDGRLTVDHRATTDVPTVLNPTQHSYFNLAGHGAGDVLGHRVQIVADSFLPISDESIPTGERRAVADTPFDFREPTAVGEHVGDADRQVEIAGGFDHTFMLRRSGPGLIRAATVSEPATGRTMTVETTEPGVQLYTANGLDGSLTGKGGAVYGHRAGLCLETQHPPDAPNQPGFPSAVLRPGGTFASQTVYAFGTDAD